MIEGFAVSNVSIAQQAASEENLPKKWYQAITPYQWVVLLVCYAGGMFDGLDSSLFTLILKPAVSELLGTQDVVAISGKGIIIGVLFLLGWTAGGMIFGILGDKIGRVKALSLSILIYALFTGLCGVAQTWEQLALFRFITALGIGGELIVGTTLLAESWPEKYRTRAVGFLTTAYQAGYCLVGAMSLGMGYLLGTANWRYLFFLGALPALIIMVIRRRVEEPERWQALEQQRKSAEATHVEAGFFDLFKRTHLRNTLVASTFTGALLIAYWASTFWIPTWIHQLLPNTDPFREKSITMLLIGGFAVFGCIWAGYLAEQVGRRWTVVLANAGYLAASIGLFGLNSEFSNAIYLWSAALGVFVGMNIAICYIYVPELFPTRLRATGTGFCFNLGRIAAAIGLVFSGQLIQFFGGSYAQAALSLSYILVLAIFIVALAPETKGQLLKD